MSRSPPSSAARRLDAGWLVQLVDLGMPFGYGEQAPFLGRKISAIRLGTAPDNDAACRHRHPRASQLDALSPPRAGLRVDPRRRSTAASSSRAARQGTSTWEAGSSAAGRSSSSCSTALVPFLVGAIDLFARSRRRRLPLPGGWRALRTRFGVWLWIGLLVGLGALAGVFPRGSAIPPPPGSAAVSDWPVAGLVVLGLLAALGWLRARRVLVPVARRRR